MVRNHSKIEPGLSDSSGTPIAAVDAPQQRIARIALDIPLPGLFDYLAGETGPADIGRRVLVPFGSRQLSGIVIELTDSAAYDPAKLKAVTGVLDDMPPVSTDILALWQFCSDYYQHPLGQVAFTALPVLLRQTRPFTDRQPRWLALTASGQAELAQAVPARARVARALLEQFAGGAARHESALRETSPSAARYLKQWQEEGYLHAVAAPAIDPLLELGARPELNTEQQAAVDAVSAALQQFQPWLLFGVTGSGKTEVYLRLIEQVLAQGRQALVLVPEINLTPQLLHRFRSRFPHANIVTLTSGLADSERTRNWLAAQAGEARIVLGTRLAVFTPMPDLGLILIDEEHDGSFKQQDGLRYSARDVAVYRAHQANIPIVLGSATPALETWHNARTKRYRLLRLRQRAAALATLPVIRTVDTRRSQLIDGMAPVTIDAIRQRLARGEQSLVFINRRGYAPVLFCSDCGWSSECDRCSARLVVHLRERRLRCHHCGHEQRIPVSCPDCGNLDMKPVGQGTQRIEEALTAIFPDANILRIDRDSTRRKEAWNDILEQVHSGSADILVGTQMLSKGHDFPGLSLVCALNADAGLYSPDFRAAERLFGQLMQVAGRAGRAGLAGEVLIQTNFPDHELYSAVARHDFEGYATQLLSERSDARFPPYVYQAVLRAEAGQLALALAFLQRAADAGRALNHPVSLYDPVAASMQRLAGRERAQLLVQHATRPALQAFLREWMPALRKLGERQVRWSLDVDPLDL